MARWTNFSGLTTLVFGCMILGAAARADTILWVDDSSGNIGQVDITTQSVVAGSVHNTGLSLTDIGFNSTGTLYGTTFTGLYSINTSTGTTTSLGSYGFGGGSMNALVGSGGTNLFAASAGTNDVYEVNPGSPGTAVSTIASPDRSAGDLAFGGSTLYESGIDAQSGLDQLVNVTKDSVVGFFKSGNTYFGNVFGLADNGTTMYAVNGTTVYSVDLSTGGLTSLFNYGGHGLSYANGTAFINEGAPVPEPSSLLLFATALAAFWAFRGRLNVFRSRRG